MIHSNNLPFTVGVTASHTDSFFVPFDDSRFFTLLRMLECRIAAKALLGATYLLPLARLTSAVGQA